MVFVRLILCQPLEFTGECIKYHGTSFLPFALWTENIGQVLPLIFMMCYVSVRWFMHKPVPYIFLSVFILYSARNTCTLSRETLALFPITSSPPPLFHSQSVLVILSSLIISSSLPPSLHLHTYQKSLLIPFHLFLLPIIPDLLKSDFVTPVDNDYAQESSVVNQKEGPSLTRHH